MAGATVNNLNLKDVQTKVSYSRIYTLAMAVCPSLTNGLADSLPINTCCNAGLNRPVANPQVLFAGNCWAGWPDGLMTHKSRFYR